MKAPVAVVIPAHNREATLLRAIESVRKQSLQPEQVIVVDDASSDDTVEVARKAGVEVIALTSNGGAAHARNVGIQASTQPWISFLDSDDEWLPHHLATLWPYTADYVLISGGRTSDPSGRGGPGATTVRRKRRFTDPAALIFPDNPISIGATLVSREVLNAVGGFDETLRISEDFDLWLRIVAQHPALVLDVPVYTYHLHPGQKTRDPQTTRSAQFALLERYRGATWWDEATFGQRRSLNEAEVLISQGHKVRAAVQVVVGVLTQPARYLPIIAVLARNSLASRI